MAYVPFYLLKITFILLTLKYFINTNYFINVKINVIFNKRGLNLLI